MHVHSLTSANVHLALIQALNLISSMDRILRRQQSELDGYDQPPSEHGTKMDTRINALRTELSDIKDDVPNFLGTREDWSTLIGLLKRQTGRPAIPVQ